MSTAPMDPVPAELDVSADGEDWRPDRQKNRWRRAFVSGLGSFLVLALVWPVAAPRIVGGGQPLVIEDVRSRSAEVARGGSVRLELSWHVRQGVQAGNVAWVELPATAFGPLPPGSTDLLSDGVRIATVEVDERRPRRLTMTMTSAGARHASDAGSSSLWDVGSRPSVVLDGSFWITAELSDRAPVGISTLVVQGDHDQFQITMNIKDREQERTV